MKILAVDDEQMITKLLHNILEAKGHDIHTASNINETMKTFDSSFDLVIVDRFLSGPHNEASDDGIKLIKTLKDRSPLTQAILITGGGTHCVNDINEIIQSGINLGRNQHCLYEHVNYRYPRIDLTFVNYL